MNLKKIVFNPWNVFKYLAHKGYLNWLDDRHYLMGLYRGFMGCKLNLNNPSTFNEKLQWLKLYDHNQNYTMLVDKYLAKEKVASIIGEEYIVPTLGVWDNVEDINFDMLPDKFVLKTTHDSGGVIICKDKKTLDVNNVKKLLHNSLNRDYYLLYREWPYKNVQHRIICEEYLDNNGHQPDDYKILCFNGKPNNTMVCVDRETGTTKYYFFDNSWNLIRCNGWGMKAPDGFTLPRPENLDEMLSIASKLSRNIPTVRVDLYNINGKVYFGELTFFPDSGFDSRITKSCDLEFGAQVNLDVVRKR